MNELLACPFCGNNETEMNEGIDKFDGKYHVCCGAKDVWCPMVAGLPFRDTIDEAVKDWNTRTQPEPVALTVEQLRGMEQCGTGVYVGNTDGSTINWGRKFTAAVLDKTWVAGSSETQLQAIYGRGLTLAESDYGKTWLAYTHKPRQEP